MKTFNEQQMANPWSWCVGVIEKYELSSRMVAEATGAPRSTLRSLFNGNNTNPRYELLCKVIQLCIDIENGGGFFPKKTGKKEKVAPKQPKQSIDDFL
jgi:hypothetical protein